MKIIGHRGAAGLAPENTIASFKAARSAGVDWIEFDVRKTADDKLVVCHDASLKRTFGIDKVIRQHTLQELKASCPDLPTFTEALTACGSTPVLIELKEVIDPLLLQQALKQARTREYSFASFLPAALQALKPVFPKTDRALLSYRHFGGRVKKATAIGANGIGMHFALISHFPVWRARRRRFKIYTYTVDSRFIAWLYHRIFPDIAICTNRPDRVQRLRTK